MGLKVILLPRYKHFLCLFPSTHGFVLFVLRVEWAMLYSCYVNDD